MSSQGRPLFSIILFATCAFAASRSVWDGVYTKAQANRGLAVYREACLSCHGENLLGAEAGPAIAGEEFMKAWSGKTAADYFAQLRKTMPEDDPGNLSTRQYADLVAYIFSVNNFPAGATELDREVASLKEIRIEPKKE